MPDGTLLQGVLRGRTKGFSTFHKLLLLLVHIHLITGTRYALTAILRVLRGVSRVIGRLPYLETPEGSVASSVSTHLYSP